MIDNNITTKGDITQTSKSLSDNLNFISQNILIYLPLIFLIFGLIGFIGNVFTYLQPQLRSNTCCIYSLCGSFIDIIDLCINSFPSYLAWQFGFTLPWSTSSALCKFYIFIVVFLPHLSINFLCTAIIDRFAITCDHTSSIRRITQLRIVPWMIGLTVLTSGLFSLYVPINYDLMYGYLCISIQPMVTSISYIVLIGLISPIIMIIFVLLTYRNVRRSRGRVGEVTRTRGQNLRNQFIVTIFAQILITSFIALQWIIMFTYFTFAPIYTETPVDLSIIFFLLSLSTNLYYLNNVKAFYITILTSRVFRKAFVGGLNNLFRRYIRQQMNVSMVNPFTQTRN
ncbi:unnamed protein product [Adineta steineri]|uniref:G-protein coupled receptors family 1 profile domain-containing protein n=1 Tax=Adineta steineri TaxID=433720 RepID=A0A814TVM5_9BILA|nr:unnamed protein product [Adineta steineri]CAF1157939.1 unnamed protein product [Adineta steineri]CAF1163326.1 unnamed protein product [Adineta steineri]CAF1350062.1 unnamed protein product [Adineta steineri]